ncbi:MULTISPECIES: AMIN-like domain-containing (lipo)protein [unclassified Geodermatophilus]|uniref:AMIN-like domain-containing (lipo)protein n=1 Tax=unclassified Geodermatophilus TaxID=2637632 RepID=UPI003EE927E3
MTRPAVPLAGSLLLSVALLAGCGEDGSAAPDETTASASAPGPATGGPTGGTDGDTDTDGDDDDDGGDAPADAPPFPADVRPDTGEASADAQVTVTDIRTGRHEGFDRVVFEVDGTGTPGWDVRYVDQATSQGSGAPVEVAGDAVLQVTLTGVGNPLDTGVEEWAGPDPLPGNGTEVVAEVAWDSTFEGTSVAFVGTTAELPFRVYPLDGPARVVLEVADRG